MSNGDLQFDTFPTLNSGMLFNIRVGEGQNAHEYCFATGDISYISRNKETIVVALKNCDKLCITVHPMMASTLYDRIHSALQDTLSAEMNETATWIRSPSE